MRGVGEAGTFDDPEAGRDGVSGWRTASHVPSIVRALRNIVSERLLSMPRETSTDRAIPFRQVTRQRR
ncbi:MAG: hypothetical protein GY724_03330 [Actinomycetia bacterium]|nr:hypothetical protein [Actinomycetes bacterium]MCP4228355.1 hypothetical protein [Actinomycetes bacterium]MCP5032979.1 hypothetical protein [Actinomycetes bacterium]